MNNNAPYRKLDLSTLDEEESIHPIELKKEEESYRKLKLEDEKLETQKTQNDQTIAGKFGGGMGVNFLAGLANVSPLGILREVYETVRTHKVGPQEAHPFGWNLGQPVPIGSPLEKIYQNIEQAKSSMPKFPAFGQGGAYIGGNVLGAAAQAGKGIYDLAKMGLEYAPLMKALSSQKHAEAIMTTLGKGKSIKENAQFILDRLKGAYTSRINEYRNMLDPIKEIVKGKSIYEHPTNPELIDNSKYLSVEPTKYGFTPHMEELNEKFLKNPNFDNAHELQIQIGKEIGRLQSSKLDPAGYNQLQYFSKARNYLGEDMERFLNSESPKLGQAFKATSEYYKNQVVPYTQNNKFAKLLTKEGRFAEKANIEPKDIPDLFKVPLKPKEGIISKGEEEAIDFAKTNTEKIIKDMGEDIKPHILYSELAKGKITPKNLISKSSQEELEKKGLDLYRTEEADKLLEGLSKHMKRLKIAAYVGGGSGILGGAAGGYKGLKSLVPHEIDMDSGSPYNYQKYMQGS